jgi:quercetin dioxygenase-like cupin family protein
MTVEICLGNHKGCGVRKGRTEVISGSPWQSSGVAGEPSRVRGASVTFEPGPATAWHTHPLGQKLIVTAGLGWTQRDGGPIEEIRPGDVVWFAPNEKHRHGATPTTAMMHIALQKRSTAK